MDDHPVVQPRDGIAAGADEEPRDHGMDEASQPGKQQRQRKSERMALMLEIRLSDGSRVLYE